MNRQMKLSMLLEADSTRLQSEAAAGAAAINGLTAANDRAAAAARRATDATQGQSRAEQDLRTIIDRRLGIANGDPATGRVDDAFNAARARDIAAYGVELDRLRARYNPLYAEVARYRTVQAEIRQAHALGAISAAEMAAAISRERQASLESIAAIKGRSAAIREAAALGAIGPGAFNTANIAAQFQDIGVTAAMGMNPLQVGLQQGTQLAAVLNTMERPVQGLFAALTQVLNPLSLVTIGTVAAGTALIQYFSSAGEEAEETSLTLAEQADLIDAVAARWGNAVPAIRAYSAELSKQKDIEALLTGAAEAVDRRFEGVISRVAALQKEISGVIGAASFTGLEVGDVSALLDQAAFANFEAAARSLRAEIKAGTVEIEDYERLNRTLEGLLGSDLVQANDALAASIRALGADYRTTAAEATAMAEQAAAAAAGGPIGGGRIASGKGARTGPQPLEDFAFASRFGWSGYGNLDSDAGRRRSGGSGSRERQSDFDREIERIR